MKTVVMAIRLIAVLSLFLFCCEVRGKLEGDDCEGIYFWLVIGTCTVATSIVNQFLDMIGLIPINLSTIVSCVYINEVIMFNHDTVTGMFVFPFVSLVCISFLNKYAKSLKEKEVDTSNQDQLEIELLKMCKQAKGKDERFVSPQVLCHFHVVYVVLDMY